MPSERVTIGQLLDSGIRLSWRESLAITQGLAALRPGDARGTTPADLLSGFALEADGAVTAVTEERRALYVSELALFLAHLLPGDAAPPDRRAPATVHLVIGRALELVEAPPFASIDEFSAALARVEDRSRAALLRDEYARCLARLTPAHEPFEHSRSTAALPVPDLTEKVEKDRRTSGPRVDALRRMLRERDHHDYLVHVERLAKRSRMSDRDPARRQGPSVDTVRRWLREADRRQFEMLRTPARRRPSLLPLAGLAMAVFTTAGLGLAQRQLAVGTSRDAARNMPRPPLASGPAARRAEAKAEQAPPAMMRDIQDAKSRPLHERLTPAEQRGTVARVEDRAGVRGRTSDRRSASDAPSGRLAAAMRHQSPTASTARRPGHSTNSHAAPATANAAAAHPLRPTEQRTLVAGGLPAPAAPSTEVKRSRRPAPVRLFTAIGRRLSAVFRGT